MSDHLPHDDLARRLAAAEAALAESQAREAALRESEATLRALFDRLGQGYCELQLLRDAAGRAVDQLYLAFNPGFERMSGIPAAAALGRTASTVFPDLEPWWHQTFDRIAAAGRPARIEHPVAALGRVFEVFAYPTSPDHLTVLYEDVTDRRQAEDALRESEERQAFLLRLSDRLRPLTDAGEIRREACRMLGEQLGAARLYYITYEPELGYGAVADDYRLPGLPSLAGRYPSEAFRSTYERIAKGITWVMPDVTADRDLPPVEHDFFVAQGIMAWIAVPLAKNGTFEAAFCVVATSARAWTAHEIRLVEETAERLWAAVQRGRAEAALRDSEERFQQLARASAAGLWIRDAETLDLEFMSPAIATIYGVAPGALLGDVRRWAAAIVPEDRDTALRHLEAARQGETTTHEFRVQRASDGAFRWIRNTDFPLSDGAHIARVGGIAEDVTETRRLTEHQGVLLAELQHRVRNIMSMVRALANRTAVGATDVETYRSLLEGRLLALARVQALLTRKADAGGSLRGIIKSEVAAQAPHAGPVRLEGPDLMLSPKIVEVLTLAFHELATNAVKYGALSRPGGQLTVRWTLREQSGTPWLNLDWIETGVPMRDPPARRGFGRELIEARVPYELGGQSRLVLGNDGAHCHLAFPLTETASILETDAPHPATIFGGTLDMTGAPDLSGRIVLVVEDDYYMASDTAAALRGAGAAVLGPCPSEAATRDLLARETPTHAVLDLNLGGGGPRFEIAHWLKDRGIPFLFLTGYDPDVIPEDLGDIPRLQKPVPFRTVVEAVDAL